MSDTPKEKSLFQEVFEELLETSMTSGGYVHNGPSPKKKKKKRNNAVVKKALAYQILTDENPTEENQ